MMAILGVASYVKDVCQWARKLVLRWHDIEVVIVLSAKYHYGYVATSRFRSELESAHIYYAPAPP